MELNVDIPAMIRRVWIEVNRQCYIGAISEKCARCLIRLIKLYTCWYAAAKQNPDRQRGLARAGRLTNDVSALDANISAGLAEAEACARTHGIYETEIALLREIYELARAISYNFFPRKN